MESKTIKKATFAGGCFWCMQPPFRDAEGVTGVVSGYAGGEKENPTYEEVSSGTTGHLEAVQVTYDESRISYDALLDIFWKQIDPTDPAGQFADKGSQYHTAIFYHDEEQKKKAEESKRGLDASGKFSRPITTEIRPFKNFYPAEDYHQDYDRKNPGRYKEYKVYSGREPFIHRMWESHPRVRVFSTPGCTGCRQVKEYLRNKQIEFDEIDLAADERSRTLIIEKTGHIGSPVVQIGDAFIFGFDKKKMDALLK